MTTNVTLTRNEKDFTGRMEVINFLWQWRSAYTKYC